MVCCVPGARVWDFTECLQGILKGEGDKGQVMVHFGTSDMDRKSEEFLRQEFRE